VNIFLSDERDDPLSTGPTGHDGLVSLARLVLGGEGYPEATEVAVTLVDRERIAELNSEHMGESWPTDVLAFPIEDLVPGETPDWSEDGPSLLIGDVVICPDVVAEHAAEHGVGIGDEMALMVVHGLLHLLGYDHRVDADAERMEARERRYLEAVGMVRR
jgi:probable rRNA maturation factor